MRVAVILVVDDQARLRMLAADHFLDAGFEVLEASNGAEASALLRQSPDIGGGCHQRADAGSAGRPLTGPHSPGPYPDCAIKVVSSRSAPRAGDMAERAGCVLKPYRGEEIAHLVNRNYLPGTDADSALER